jgi:hypothetical protein
MIGNHVSSIVGCSSFHGATEKIRHRFHCAKFQGFKKKKLGVFLKNREKIGSGFEHVV